MDGQKTQLGIEKYGHKILLVMVLVSRVNYVRSETG